MNKIKAIIKIDEENQHLSENFSDKIIKAFNLDDENNLIEIVTEEEVTQKDKKEDYIIILWHSQKSLLKLFSRQVSIKSGERESRNLDFVLYDEHIVPVIHLTNITLLPTNNTELEKIEKRRIKVKWSRHVSRMDSSIWHYYYSLEEHICNPQRFNSIIDDIRRNMYGYDGHSTEDNGRSFNRYNLSIAEEYEDFYSRLSNSCYICSSKNGGHSANVSPFLFHSERFMRTFLFDDKEKEILSHNLNWRILLVDDHATEPMSGSSGVQLSKLDIIKNDFYRIGFSENANCVISNSTSIEFDCVTSVSEAYEKLKPGNKKSGNKYDIILLDYKLDVQNGKQEYGYELLEKIRDDQEEKNNHGEKKELNPGPNDTFYFMFISAYTTAVQERLQMEGFYISKDYWLIGRGACPTNTPYLFLYCLKRMMDIRYDKLTKHSKQLLKDLNKRNNPLTFLQIEEEKGKYATMTMFLTKLYEKDKERNNCVLGFNAFLNLRRVYDTIKHDVDHTSNTKEERNMKSSPLIMSLFRDEEFCSNSFWEHLQNLVYLTAFGTIRQWPEMWEDYMFIKTKLKKAEDVIWNSLDAEVLQGKTPPSILIRNYILSLKGMMS